MLFKNKFRIESTRLKEYNYSFPNWYYITINTNNHREFFGGVINNKFVPNKCGKIADEEWNNIAKIRSGVELDYYVIMPNHIHGIVIINKSTELRTVKTHRDASLQSAKQNTSSQDSVVVNSLSNIIRGFKGSVTNRIHLQGIIGFKWQPSFYDHIIRTEKDLARIREYIYMNPLKWEIEKNNPENIFKD